MRILECHCTSHFSKQRLCLGVSSSFAFCVWMDGAITSREHSCVRFISFWQSERISSLIRKVRIVSWVEQEMEAPEEEWCMVNNNGWVRGCTVLGRQWRWTEHLSVVTGDRGYHIPSVHKYNVLRIDDRRSLRSSSSERFVTCSFPL